MREKSCKLGKNTTKIFKKYHCFVEFVRYVDVIHITSVLSKWVRQGYTFAGFLYYMLSGRILIPNKL